MLTAAQVEGGHMVRQLLIDGADVNGTSLTGHIALQLASQHGHSGNVQQLLEYPLMSMQKTRVATLH